MDTPTKSQTLPKLGLGIEDLMRAAFVRTKERFLSYILAYLLAILIMLGVFAGVAILAGINALIWAATQSVGVTMFTAFISIIATVLGFIYVGSWTGLAMIASVISPTKMSVTEYYKSVKPYVWDYFGVSVVTMLFFLGLLPFGILSLFIIYIFWSIWGAFLVFVFLDRKEKGLQNLFVSKAIVSQMFWGVLLRIAVLYISYYAIVYIFTLAQTSSKEGSAFVGLLSFIFSLAAGPYLLSYVYELYRNLPEPKEVGTNMVWKILSIIGGVIMIASLILGGAALSRSAPELLENMQNSKSFEKQLLKELENSGSTEGMSEEESAQFEEEVNRMMKEFESESGAGN